MEKRTFSKEEMFECYNWDTAPTSLDEIKHLEVYQYGFNKWVS